MLAALADPGAASQIGYARWRNDFPDGADWFSLLLSGSAIRTGGNLNYALLDDPRVDSLIARASSTWTRAGRGALVGGRAGRRGPRPLGAFANGVRDDILSAPCATTCRTSSTASSGCGPGWTDRGAPPGASPVSRPASPAGSGC